LWPWLWRLQGLWRQGLWLSWLWLWRRLRILLRLVGHLPPLLTPSCVQACSGYIEEAKKLMAGFDGVDPAKSCLLAARHRLTRYTRLARPASGFPSQIKMLARGLDMNSSDTAGESAMRADPQGAGKPCVLTR
jgi:hypothetical protein